MCSVSPSMTPTPNKRLLIALSLGLVVFVVLAGWGWGRATMGEIHATLADGWTQMLLEERDAALERTNVAVVASSLRWVGRFYRPPEPPPAGIERNLYNLMERVRSAAQHDIVRHLRSITGDQLSDDPKLWIEKYAKPEK